jgi:hypothetical protein
MENPYQVAIDAANKELAELRQREAEAKLQYSLVLKNIATNAQILTQFIEYTRAMMKRGENRSLLDAPNVAPNDFVRLFPEDRPNIPNVQAPLWQKAAFVMLDRHTPFTVGDVLDEMKAHGMERTDKNRVQIMRKAILDKPTIFKKIEGERGKYILLDNEKEATEVTS